MSDTVKLIIEIPKYYLGHPQDYTCLAECVRRGIPLDTVKDWKFYYDHGYAQAKRDLSENKGEKGTDLISRKSAQAKIKKICEKYGYTYDDSGVFEWGTSSKAWGHALDDLPTYFVPEREKGEWIPVTERLPKDGQSVLFCDIDDDIMVGYHVKGRPATHFSQDGTYEDMKNVRAWQPLPEPYKAESEDKK